MQLAKVRPFFVIEQDSYFNCSTRVKIDLLCMVGIGAIEVCGLQLHLVGHPRNLVRLTTARGASFD